MHQSFTSLLNQGKTRIMPLDVACRSSHKKDGTDKCQPEAAYFQISSQPLSIVEVIEQHMAYKRGSNGSTGYLGVILSWIFGWTGIPVHVG